MCHLQFLFFSFNLFVPIVDKRYRDASIFIYYYFWTYRFSNLRHLWVAFLRFFTVFCSHNDSDIASVL
jgi:hypothetical protein